MGPLQTVLEVSYRLSHGSPGLTEILPERRHDSNGREEDGDTLSSGVGGRVRTSHHSVKETRNEAFPFSVLQTPFRTLLCGPHSWT